MKCLCDRCKTRYSIGDDRVRGKILKIRCKNCANVITVREGMTADEPDRRLRPTTAAPMAAAAAPAGSALGSAFVAQMTAPQKPPTIASSSSARRSMPERSGSTRKSSTSTSVTVLVLVVLDRHGARGAGVLEHDQLVPIGRLERRAGERLRGGPEGHLVAVETEHEIE